MISGAALTATGAITGNAKLSKWGGILSLAGGIGGLATGAWSSVASDVAGQAAQEGAVAFEHSAASYGSDALGAGGMTGSEAGGNAALSQANVGAIDPSASAGASSGGMPAGAQQATAPNLSAPAVTSPAIPANGPSAMAPGTNAPATDGGLLGGLKSGMTWAEKNPRLTQAGAGLLQSGLGAYGQQEAAKTQIALQEEAQARARARLNDSVKGVRVPTYQPLPRG